jgi:hypothetical protein
MVVAAGLLVGVVDSGSRRTETREVSIAPDVGVVDQGSLRAHVGCDRRVCRSQAAMDFSIDTNRVAALARAELI